MSIVIHEVSHGFAAESFGDNTARRAGRLTLNPISHLELFGSIVLPAILIITNAGFLFGWAKPVPFDPSNFRNRRAGTLAVASAGVAANFLIAIIFGLILRFVPMFWAAPANFYLITSAIVIVNLALGVFNLVPIPPLDGSKILFSILPESMERYLDAMEQYAIIYLIVFIVFFAEFLSPIVAFLFRLITGLAF